MTASSADTPVGTHGLLHSECSSVTFFRLLPSAHSKKTCLSESVQGRRKVSTEQQVCTVRSVQGTDSCTRQIVSVLTKVVPCTPQLRVMRRTSSTLPSAEVAHRPLPWKRSGLSSSVEPGWPLKIGLYSSRMTLNCGAGALRA